LVLFVVSSPSTSMFMINSNANHSHFTVIKNTFADSKDEENQIPVPVEDQNSTMGKKTAIEDVENVSNKTEEVPIIDCTKNDEKLCINKNQPSKQDLIIAEENPDTPIDPSYKNRTEALPTINKSSNFTSPANETLPTAIKLRDVYVYVAGNFPVQGSVGDCLAKAHSSFSGLGHGLGEGTKIEGEDCNIDKTTPPKMTVPGDAGRAIIDQVLAAGSSNHQTTTKCAEKEDPRGPNPYADDTGGDTGGVSQGSKDRHTKDNGEKGLTVKVVDKDGNTKYYTWKNDGRLVLSDKDGNIINNKDGDTEIYFHDGTVDAKGDWFKDKSSAGNGDWFNLTQDPKTGNWSFSNNGNLEPLHKRTGGKKTGGMPVDGDQDSQQICKDFQAFMKNCERTGPTTKECARVTKGCEGYDPTIALTTGEDSCKKSEIDKEQVKKIASLRCMQNKKPLPGEDPCAMKVTRDPCKTYEGDKNVSPTIGSSSGDNVKIAGCITAKTFDPCVSGPTALRDEPCPVTEIKFPFSELGNPTICLPDEITGDPTVTTCPTDNEPPKGPEPKFDDPNSVLGVNPTGSLETNSLPGFNPPQDITKQKENTATEDGQLGQPDPRMNQVN